jgi:hypothetical protein
VRDIVVEMIVDVMGRDGMDFWNREGGKQERSERAEGRAGELLRRDAGRLDERCA